MVTPCLLAGIASVVVLAAGPQSMPGMQHQHMMPMDASGDGRPTWRMPPMNMMPMAPGLEKELPPVAPFLAGTGLDPSTLPEAVPARIVELSDGGSMSLTATLVRRTINGKTLVMYGYNGQYPGPLIKVTRGSTITVHFTNDIDLPTTVHWHGLRLDNRFDGVPGVTQAPVGQGQSFTYEVHFRDTGVYWYHPHMREDIQQDLGLYGNMLVAAPEPGYYATVNREEALILDDLLMDDAGLIPFGEEAPTHALMGRFGNVMLVNGTPDYQLSVKRGEVVRFFLTNVANSRTFNVVFGGARVKVVASDVGKFEREAWVDSVVIAPAERYVVEVRFDRAGDVPVTNSIQAINEFRGEFYPHVDRLGVIHVSEEPVADDYGTSFAVLRRNQDVERDIDAFRPMFDRPVDHRLELRVRVGQLPPPIIQSMEFERGLYAAPVEWNDAMPMMNWLSTAKQVTWILEDPETGRENMDIHWTFRQGQVARIRIHNDPSTIHPMNHPIHLHGQRFLVLSRDGVPNGNLVWKDTAIVPVGTTMDMLADMSNPGIWMLHCHIAEHLHAGMMMTFTVEDGPAGRSARK
jgi:suppressor of ftsI